MKSAKPGAEGSLWEPCAESQGIGGLSAALRSEQCGLGSSVSPWVLVGPVRASDWRLSRSAMVSSWGALLGTPWWGLCGVQWESHGRGHTYWHSG